MQLETRRHACAHGTCVCAACTCCAALCCAALRVVRAAHSFIRSVILSFCRSLILSFFPSFLSLYLSVSARCARRRGLTFTFARVVVSSTFRWATLATRRREEPHYVCSRCGSAHFGRVATACVSSPQRLGCFHWLAHTARHKHF